MSYAVGIDLGTTYSAVAVMQPTGTPKILPNREGDAITASVVLFKNVKGKDAPVVGAAAKRQAALRPDDVVQYVKRYMGDPSWRFDSSNDEQYRPEEISAIILRDLVNAAEERLGEPVESVVITVPAYFDDSRRTATKQAGSIAGLNVLRVLNEPTAAALSYGLSTDEDGTVLVYDLGGGTFDVTILGIENRSFEVLATDGDRNLGGFDWDNTIMNLVAAELEISHGVTDLFDDIEAVATLREKAEQAKRALSSSERTSIQLSLDSGHFSAEITREQFEQASKNLLRRTQELVEDTLDDSGLTWGDIDQVLLVGGSTRMPAVRELLVRLSGMEPVEGVDPDQAVALGAAIQAELSRNGDSDSVVSGISIQDVTSHGLGTSARNPGTGEMGNVVIIPKNPPIPTSGQQIFSYSVPITEMDVDLTQGDDADLEFVTEIGRGAIQLDEEWPAGTDFRLVYHYDIDQTVTVEVFRLPEDAFAGSFSIDRVANLDETAVADATAKLSGLPGLAPPSVLAGPLLDATPLDLPTLPDLPPLPPLTTQLTTQSETAR
jgi:molecular chaperone DnaK